MAQYDAIFKRPKCGKLLTIRVTADTISEATRLAKRHVEIARPNQGYNLYGGPLVVKE